MILESIEISNIRSIRSERIDFPASTMLFFGDVGSGKSSVLKSIEFALFGTLIHGDLSGDSLLRRGKTNGLVNLAFSIDGKKYTIKRNLSRDRKGRVAQKESTFIDHDKGTTTTFAPSDMRRKILSLLSYSVSRYEKATKLPLFRYTVYTPQEQVKEIIQADPDERFEILKEVFGIEKYEIALKNIDLIKDFLNDKIKEFKIHIKQIGEPEQEILEKEKILEDIMNKIAKLESALKGKEGEIRSQENTIEKIQEELNSYSKKLVEINNKESNIKEYREKQKTTKLSLNNVKKEILQKESELKKLKEVEIKTEIDEDQLEKHIETNQNQKIQLEKDLAIVKKSIKDIDNLLKKGQCSLCGQAIHEKDRFEKELKQASAKVEKLTTEIDNVSKQLNEQKKNLKDLLEFQKIKIKKDSLVILVSEKRKREADLNILINELFNKINNNQTEIITILSEYKDTNLRQFKELGQYIKDRLKNEKNSLQKLKSNKETLGNDLSAQKNSIEYIHKELKELESNIQTRDKLNRNLIYYTQIKNWISEEFPVLIRDIEKKILSSSAHHFNSYFKEWFHELVEDKNIEVEIRTEDFQPIIHVNGFESPFRDLSGGEKSGLSLSYRLALNKIINERHQEVKTKDLLILDEPTDGFSQQQINRMQSIFEKLNTSQMIIISHERNLDSFVTDIYHFEKENHITKISKENI
ncbi:MAG: hypothetical protein ACFE8N_01650 [Promethearchaeota archaeon]